MYDRNMAKAQCEAVVSGAGMGQSPTLSENIDYRIAHLKDQVERLERVKALLAQPSGLLNIPIDDLRFAMNY